MVTVSFNIQNSFEFTYSNRSQNYEGRRNGIL